MKHECGASIEPGMTMCRCGELLIWEGDMLETDRRAFGTETRAQQSEPATPCELCERPVPADAAACSFCGMSVSPRAAAGAANAANRILATVTLPDGATVKLGPGPLTLGRLSEDNRVGSALDRDEVSRRHARLYLRDGAVWITDLDSTNGTWLSGREITDEVRLEAGDHLVGLGRRVTVTVHVPRELGMS
ncbi:FHA domain-containing protein [Agromyces sp. NPDC056523]|uniref:FHA domain-containing protein n=1 Tax=Agromyces sp. NPDC056523 TaxID=3345850 RepID=UPI00366DB28D